MALTVLSLVNSAMKQINQPQATTLVTTNDPNEQQLESLLQSVCQDLLQSKNWPQLGRTQTITTVSGQSSYPLPADYYCPLLDSFWDQTNQWKIGGASTDSAFNTLLYGYAVSTGQESFRVFGRNGTNQMQLIPTPGATNLTLSFDYISSYYILTAGTTWQGSVSTNTDVTAFDDQLVILGIKWKYLQAKGLDYEEMQAEYEKKKDTAFARWQGSQKTMLSGYDNSFFGAYIPNVKAGGWNI